MVVYRVDIIRSDFAVHFGNNHIEVLIYEIWTTCLDYRPVICVNTFWFLIYIQRITGDNCKVQMCEKEGRSICENTETGSNGKVGDTLGFGEERRSLFYFIFVPIFCILYISDYDSVSLLLVIRFPLSVIRYFETYRYESVYLVVW